MNVVLFCGGRGSSSIIKEFLKRDVNLTLIINGYDDGLSTGLIRDKVIGMLGPSDFRKNLSTVCDADFLEYRLTRSDGSDLDAVSMPKTIKRLVAYGAMYLKGADDNFDFSDVAIGNLAFVGAFKESHNNFNLAVRVMENALESKAKILNATDGNVRRLTALCSAGAPLLREHQIVNKHPEPIQRIFLNHITIDSLFKQLGSRALFIDHYVPQTNMHVISALNKADVIVYGPGTQHSSLFPSYMSCWPFIMKARCPKIMIMNLDKDHDIADFSRTDVIRMALRYLNDEANLTHQITHTLINVDDPAYAGDISSLLGVRAIYDSFRSVSEPTRHDGEAVVNMIEGICNV